MDITLDRLVLDFARGVERADAHGYQHTGQTRTFAAGIGPHSEDRTVELVLAEMTDRDPESYGPSARHVPYEPGSRQECDLCLGEPPTWTWAIEVKLLRMLGDNGKEDPNMPKRILSPYPAHNSALTDTRKLAAGTLGHRRAILIVAYDYPNERRPSMRFRAEPMVDAFETLARSGPITLGPRQSARFEGLIHPHHREGFVFGWEVEPR